MDTNQIIFLVIMCSSILLFITEWVRVDVVGVLIILSLAITGLLDTNAALSGFSSEPAIIVAAVFILSAGLNHTGATDMIARLFKKISTSNESIATLVVMIGVAAMSSVTHHLMITALMLPIVMKLCQEKNFSSSRMLIPMATAASLGTTLTLIGAPAFLLSNQIIKRSGAPALDLFSPGKVGSVLVLTGFLVIIILRWLLPEKTGVSTDDNRFKHDNITTEVLIPENSQWIGKSLEELKQSTTERFQVLSIFRGRKTISSHLDNLLLAEKDVLLIETNSDELVSIEEKLGLVVRAFKKFGDYNPDLKEENNIVEAVVGPDSQFIGKTISDMNFFDNYGVVVVAIWRKAGWIREKLSQVTLQHGDLIVLWGPSEKLEGLTEYRNFLLFVPFHGKSKKRANIPIAATIMALSILTATFEWLPAHIAFLAGAAAMIIFKCVSIDDAYNSVETRVFVMIAGVIPLGLAMQKVGFDKLSADLLVQWTEGLTPFQMLMIFFWFAALLTQILSDAATTVLIAPIALAFAQKAGFSPVAAVVTVTIGAIASFLTPIGHHGNLLILGPGGYKFADFFKIGLPLTIVISFITCFLSLRIWS